METKTKTSGSTNCLSVSSLVRWHIFVSAKREKKNRQIHLNDDRTCLRPARRQIRADFPLVRDRIEALERRDRNLRSVEVDFARLITAGHIQQAIGGGDGGTGTPDRHR